MEEIAKIQDYAARDNLNCRRPYGAVQLRCCLFDAHANGTGAYMAKITHFSEQNVVLPALPGRYLAPVQTNERERPAILTCAASQENPLQYGTRFFQKCSSALITCFFSTLLRSFQRRVPPALLCACVLLSCAGQAGATPAPPIRFLLSFDDGPSAAHDNNPTSLILDTLAHNAVQPGIKAVFFTQTRAANGGGSAIGIGLLRREFEAGHLLAFHTATPHHANHRYLSAEELDLSLQRGVADLSAITGVAPSLVRPPFWNYDARTQTAYKKYGMRLLLTDLSANDGKIWGVNFSWHKRSNMLKHLAEVRARWAAGAMPVVDGSVPVVVTFHDVNTYTARHIEEYLEILLDVARELELPTNAKPFYDERGELERAALARTVRDGAAKPPLPGIWNWLWQ